MNAVIGGHSTVAKALLLEEGDHPAPGIHLGALPGQPRLVSHLEHNDAEPAQPCERASLESTSSPTSLSTRAVPVWAKTEEPGAELAKFALTTSLAD